jgi:hypothetical protein
VGKFWCGFCRERVVWVEEEEGRGRRGAPAAWNSATVKRGLEGGRVGWALQPCQGRKPRRMIP